MTTRLQRCIFALALCASLLCTKAGLAQVPITSEDPHVLHWTAAQQRAWYPAMEKVFKMHIVHHGRSVRPLPSAGIEVPISYQYKGRTWTADDYMKDNQVSGVIALKDGKIILERYGLGRTATDRWTSFSVAKSVTSMLVGAAIQDGKLRLDERVTDRLPELKGSVYDGVTLRELLTMSSGVKWNEDYEDPKSDVAQLVIPRESRVDPILSYVKQLPRAAPPGTTFHYNTSNTDLVGIMLGRAVGMTLADYLSAKIWKPYGMEADALWMVDFSDHERAGCCLSMTLRDYARFGEFVLEGGKIGKDRVVPADWVEESTRAQISNGRPAPAGYGYFWWIGMEAYEASGIFGQSILIYPKDRLIIVINAAWPKAMNEEVYRPMSMFQGALHTAARELVLKP